jgi:sugar/nucleoside kinase (ribokinase family)
MSNPQYDVLGIGNAIVDVIARTEEDFLVANGMRKGGMALIDETRAHAIHAAMRETTEISGGSAANTIVGVASLGGRGAFIGKVKGDALGEGFGRNLREAGVNFTTPAAKDGPSTARSYIFVTPDGERTMNTYLGAAQNLHPDDVDADAVGASAITYLEGYLWDPRDAKDAFLKAAAAAHAAGREVALTLSDAFCVDRWRDEFLHLLRSGTVDLLFANETELHSLYQTAAFDVAVAALAKDARHAVVTRSEKGCIVVDKTGAQAVPAHPVTRLVDTTGAGDLFAAGFLVGHARGRDAVTSARLGALAAAEVIQHIGARPQTSLKALAEKAGLVI